MNTSVGFWGSGGQGLAEKASPDSRRFVTAFYLEKMNSKIFPPACALLKSPLDPPFDKGGKGGFSKRNIFHWEKVGVRVQVFILNALNKVTQRNYFLWFPSLRSLEDCFFQVFDSFKVNIGCFLISHCFPQDFLVV